MDPGGSGQAGQRPRLGHVMRHDIGRVCGAAIGAPMRRRTSCRRRREIECAVRGCRCCAGTWWPTLGSPIRRAIMRSSTTWDDGRVCHGSSLEGRTFRSCRQYQGSKTDLGLDLIDWSGAKTLLVMLPSLLVEGKTRSKPTACHTRLLYARPSRSRPYGSSFGKCRLLLHQTALNEPLQQLHSCLPKCVFWI